MATTVLGQAGSRPGQLPGLRPRLRAHRHQAPAEAGDRQRRAAQALPLRCHRPALALRHLAVKDDETERSAVAFLNEAAAAFPFRLTRVLTDNGSCFTPAFASACAALGAECRHTKPYSPHTNGMVERFNGRVGGEVQAITIYSHQQLERLLRGFNAAYNAQRQRVLDGRTPDQVVAERLRARRKLANAKPHGRAGPADIAEARLIAEAAKEVSQPDKIRWAEPCPLTAKAVRSGRAVPAVLADIQWCA